MNVCPVRERRVVGALVVAAAILGAGTANSPGQAAPRDPRPASPLNIPSAIASGPDGKLWVVDGDGIVRVTTRGAMARVAAVRSVYSIARGPDGAMWFTAGSPPRIGRITASGQQTYFTAGISQIPFSIVAGPDGNLWFTEGGSEQGRIARITPTGAITEFSHGLHKESSPDGIVTGPDGNLWFTDIQGSIGRITPTGAITEYRLPENASRTPSGIAAGSDGALWFSWDDQIGRITTRGRVRFYDARADLVDRLARGPDGNIWYTAFIDRYRGTASVGRITPRGRISIFGRGFTSSAVNGIATGPDGNLWVTEIGRTRDHVARVTPHGVATEFPPPPPCRVPGMLRMTLAWVKNALFSALCRLDPASKRAGRRRGTVVVGASPRHGTVLPYSSRVRVEFQRLPPLPSRCALPFASQRLVATPHMLVFDYAVYDDGGFSQTKKYGACLKPNGRPRIVVSSFDDGFDYSDASGFRAARRFVAYQDTYTDHYGAGSLSLNVYDVRGGRSTFSTTVETWDPTFGPYEVLGDYALSRRGFVAWFSVFNGTTSLYVNRKRRARLLDRGALAGLHFRGDTLFWTSNGKQKSIVVH